jgi:hypothetical protein
MTPSAKAKKQFTAKEVEAQVMNRLEERSYDEFIDQFIVDYFAALGISHLSPFPHRTASGPEYDMYPFSNFDEQDDAAIATAEEDRPAE